jgi:hypothetical protein
VGALACSHLRRDSGFHEARSCASPWRLMWATRIPTRTCQLSISRFSSQGELCGTSSGEVAPRCSSRSSRQERPRHVFGASYQPARSAPSGGVEVAAEHSPSIPASAQAIAMKNGVGETQGPPTAALEWQDGCLETKVAPPLPGPNKREALRLLRCLRVHLNAVSCRRIELFPRRSPSGVIPFERHRRAAT